MKRSVFASFVTILVALSAQAVTYDVKVAFDTDRHANTGCTLTTPSGSFAGAEYVLITRVDVTGGVATTLGTTRQTCVGGAFAPAVPADTHTWGAGLSSSGNLFIETHIAPSDLGLTNITPMRLGFFITNGGALNDGVMANHAGTDILFPAPGRHRAISPTGNTRNITLDGASGDWNGIPALAGGGNGTADLRILNTYAFGMANDLFFAISAQANHNAPTARPDSYSVAPGGTLDITTPGVLLNDTDPNNLALTATLVAGVQHGTLTLNPNGSFNYTNDGSPAPLDTFEYKAKNSASLESNVAQVQIAIGLDSGPPPPPTPKFTSADHTTFIAGQPNTFTITTTPPNPTPAITIIGGSLPNGVTFHDNGDGTATLSGTPNSASGGVYQVGFKAQNVVGEATQLFTLTVNQLPSFVSPNAVTFTVGSGSTFNINATGFPSPGITMSGTLPAGVTFNGGTGTATLSGNPASGTGGIYTLLFTASNSSGSTSQTFTLTVNQAPTFTSAAGTTFTVGTPGSFTVTLNGFPPPSVVEAGALPAGVTFNSATRVLSGTPGNGTAGTYPITFTASNGVGGPVVQNFTLLVTCPVITITPASLPAGTATQPYSQNLAASGGTAPYTFTLNSGSLPPGIILAGSTLSGTPTTTGTFNFSIKGTDSLGCFAIISYSLTIGCPAITVNPASLPNATQNVAYGPQNITATGGVAPYTFSTVPANLPPGLTLTSGGVLSGTPTTAGTFNFTVTATDANGCTGNRPYTILVCVTPSVSITPSATTFCAGTNVIFTATPVNGGGAPIYQWKVNGTNAGTNSPTFATSALANGDQVTVTMTSNASPCTTANPVTSNTVTVTVNPNPATPVITPTPSQVCAGSTGNTASGPAGATTYAWSIVNGTITSATNIQNITYTAGASGTVDLTLTVTNASGCPASNTTNVTINPTPAAPVITALPPQVCASSTGNSASGPAGATTYAWSIVNGAITSATNIQNITYTAGASGTVDLTLVVTNASGCSASSTANIIINANPTTPTITPTPASVCANSTGNTADGPAGATTYAWSIVNGTITSATNIQTITYTAGASGTVDLTLVVTNGATCSASNTVNVTINANPATPAITPTPAAVCANSTGNTASGPAGATTYAWSIVNGTITSATNTQNITYTAGVAGTTDLTLVVTNASGCSATNTVNVTVNANPATPAITPTPAQVCALSTGNSAAGPAGATTYAWSIVNGTITSATNIQTITYTAGASGTVDLTLIVTNAAGCSATNTVNVTINANPATPTITPTPAAVCALSTGNSADGPAGATTYAWSIVNGTITSAANIQTITYTAGASGTVDLTLVVTNAAGCSATNTINVPINANPATPTITPTPAQVCALSTGNSAAGPAGATTYAWSIVNGTITSAANIQTITYTAGASGTVDLTLVVTNASGCSATNTVNVTINANPATPTITPSAAQVCAGSTGNTADGPAGATTYAWSIVNGTITSAANIQTITWTAGSAGTTDLTLVVTNASGCSATNTVNVTVNANPGTPTITPTPASVCALSTGNSADGPAGATTYAWSIVNGTITSAANIQTITYTAGASGTVDLTLVVTNAAGCSATNTVNVTVNANPATPTITPTPASVCALSTGNSADGPAGATTYAWSIVNGTITSAANIQTITYTAGASGTVDLTLVVTNAAGCSATNTVNVTINPSPATPTITPTPAQVCALSTGNSADGPAGATTYAWSIVNGTITSAANIQTITYTAGASGTVDLTLVVTNVSGCSATNTVNVTINANPATPTITPSAAQVCAGSTGNTADGPAGATTYAWSITNGTITSAANIQTITWTAGSAGTTGLTLVVTNAAGCSASNTVNVTVNANPATPTITPTPAQVCALSTGNSAAGPAGATTYAWSIVNGTITSAANIQTITYTAGASGTVDLTLVVTNAAGCSATNTVNVTINPSPATPTITPTPAAVCGGSTGNSAAGPAGATTYAWSIVNGTITSATNIQTITYTAGATGTVDLTLVVTNAGGCPASNTINVPINPSPATPTITPTPAQVCASSTGNSAAGPAGATTYAWSIVNGTITSATNIQTITYTAGASGTVGLTLVVTNASGCSASNSTNVTINANPTTPTITPTPAQVCANSTGNSAAGPAGATTYAWSITNGTITSAANIQTITYTAGPSGVVGLTLVVTNAAGCSASNSTNVTINANPATPTITPTPSPVCGGSTGNTASGPAGATTYAWSIVNGTITSATNIQNITYTAGATGTVDLTLVVTNAATCSASNTVNVPINPSPAVPTITAASEVCASTTGNSASGPAGATTYAWTITSGTITSATNIQTITWTANASGTVQLQLTVTNASGCATSNTKNIPINPAVTLSPAPGSIPDAVYTTGYSQAFTAGGGTPGFTYAIFPSTPPSGLSFDTNTGVLSGANGTFPNAVGVFNFDITATDSKGCTKTQSYTLTVRPKAVNDTYNTPNAVGNTQAMTTAYTPAPATPKVSYSGTILDNDSSNVAMTVSAGAACNSGVIAFNSNGNWLYTPAVNFTGTATCGYTLTSNGVTNTANVVITISNRVWWIDSNAGVAGDGRSNTPWNNTNLIAGTNAGDIIYIYNGNANNQKSKITLLANQSLVGEGVALTVNSVLLRAAGTKPVVTNSTGAAPRDVVVLNSGNTVTGLALTSSEASGALLTGSPAALTFTDSTATLTAGSAAIGINLTGGSGAVAVTNVTFSGTGTGDMIKSNTGTHTWTFVNSPITQTAGRALNATNRTGGSMNFDSSSPVTVSAGTQDGGITLTSNSGGETFTFVKKVALTMTGAARALLVSGTGTGSLTISDNTSTISTATGSAVDITDSDATATTLNITLTSVNQTGGTTGIALNNTSGTFTVQGNNSGLANGTGGTIANVTTRAVYILSSSGTTTFKSMNFSLNTAATAGVLFDNNTSGSMIGNLTGCTFTGVTGSVSQNKALLQFEVGGANAQTANVQNSYFNGSRTYGFFATGVGTSTLGVTVNQCGFGTDVNTGAPVNKPGTTITNAPAFGLGITNGTSANVTYAITNNTFWGASGALGAVYAVTISSASSNAASNLSGVFNGNKIGKTGTTGSGCSGGCAGLGLLVGLNGTFNVTMDNNDIRQTNSLGVNVFLPSASSAGTAIAHITNNIITEPDTTGAPAFQRGLVVTTGNSGGTSLTACVQMTGNTVSGAWQAANLIRITTLNTTGVLTIPGLTPLSGATGAQVDTYIESVNTVGAGNSNTTVGGAINGSASPCP